MNTAPPLPGEPVAWRWQYPDGEWSQWHRMSVLRTSGRHIEYAYAHPHAPLTEEEALARFFAESPTNGWIKPSRIWLAALRSAGLLKGEK